MVEAVFEYRIAAPRQRGDHAEIGHVAGRKQQGTWPLRERRQRFFQFVMRLLMTGDEVCSTAADAVFIRPFLQRGDHFRMIGEAEVIVAAKRKIKRAVDHDFRALRGFHHGAAPILVPRPYGRERGGEGFHGGAPGSVKAGIATSTSKMSPDMSDVSPCSQFMEEWCGNPGEWLSRFAARSPWRS